MSVSEEPGVGCVVGAGPQAESGRQVDNANLELYFLEVEAEEQSLVR